MHRAPHGHLGCLEIEGSGARAAPRQNAGEQTVYFPRDLLLDDLREVFFSAAVSESAEASSGRALQIASLVSSSCWMRDPKRL